VTQWDTLPSEQKGELAGYAVGKNGADILAPGALVKVASKSVKTAQKLFAVCKNLQIAKNTLILETAAEIGNSAKITEIVKAGQRTARLADELGFTAQEMGQLKQVGQLEATIANNIDYIAKNPALKESFELFDRAQKFLKPYKGFMSEAHARELIHQTGIKTFPRPPGIPENYRVKLSKNGAGIKYVHPKDEGTYVRVMPGKPYSPHPCQQKPYITQVKNGDTIDKYGNIVDKQVPEAHIPYEEFVYKE